METLSIKDLIIDHSVMYFLNLLEREGLCNLSKKKSDKLELKTCLSQTSLRKTWWEQVEFSSVKRTEMASVFSLGSAWPYTSHRNHLEDFPVCASSKELGANPWIRTESWYEITGEDHLTWACNTWSMLMLLIGCRSSNSWRWQCQCFY